MEGRTIEVSPYALQTGTYAFPRSVSIYNLERLLREGVCSWIGAVAVGMPAFRYDSRVVSTLLAEHWFTDARGHQCSDAQYAYTITNESFINACMIPNIANDLPNIDTGTQMFVVIGEQHHLADTSRKRAIVMLVDVSEFTD